MDEETKRGGATHLLQVSSGLSWDADPGLSGPKACAACGVLNMMPHDQSQEMSVFITFIVSSS